MKVALIVSEYSVNPLKFVSAGGVLVELRKRSIDCSLIILVKRKTVKRRFLNKNSKQKLLKKAIKHFFQGCEEPPDLYLRPKRVTPAAVLDCFEKLLGSNKAKLYEKELNEFIDSRPSRILITDNLNDHKFLDQLKKYSIDLAVVKGGGILRREFLKNFQTGIINLHGSGPLPYYRGLGSLEFALIDESPLYMNIHLIDTGVDTGPILIKKELELRGDEALAEIYGKIYAYSIGPLVDAAEGLGSGALVPIPQKHDAGRQHFLPHPLLENYALWKLRKVHSPLRSIGNKE